jgi:MFS family permease
MARVEERSAALAPDVVFGTDLTREGTSGWWTSASTAARRSLVAAFLGWMLDSFDVMLYAMVLTSLMTELGMSTGTAGQLGSLTLIASAVGGIGFGFVADRYGRTRALSASILIYSVFTAACGLARSVGQLAIFRVLLGFGMGGEWASGAALVSETWRNEHRGKALGIVQSAWSAGYGAAAVATALVLPRWGWRAVFFVGILPALIALWIRLRIDEPAIWQQSQAGGRTSRPGFAAIFRGRMRLTLALTFMNACTMFAYWGLNLWIPAYLSMPIDRGGIGLSIYAMSILVIVMQFGAWLGFVSFGFMTDAFGRKRMYVTYLLAAAALVLIYTSTRNPLLLLVLGPFVMFFGSGYFSGFGAVTAEIFPTAVRATAQGCTYNIGRVGAAVAPYAVGSLAETYGMAAALSIVAGALVLAAATWIVIPETRGQALA